MLDEPIDLETNEGSPPVRGFLDVPGELPFSCYDSALARRLAPRVYGVLRRWFRAEVHGLEHVPSGPFLGVGNHGGGASVPDVALWWSGYRTRSPHTAPLLLLAHDAFFDVYPAPLRKWLLRIGAVRAQRDTALAALAAGYAVQVYPGGDHDACRRFSERNRIVFAGRRGYAKLALEAQVPVLPVVSIGAHETWFVLRSGRRLARWLGLQRAFRLGAFPVALCFPWGLWLGPQPGYLPLPSKIELSILPPIEPHGSAEELDHAVQTAMQRELDRLAARRRYWVLG